MEKSTHAPTYNELRLELAKERLAHEQTRAAYHLLHSATASVAMPAYLPGPRWQGAAH